MDRILQILFLLFLTLSEYCNAGEYVVVGNRKIRPFSDYSVAVSWSGSQPNSFLLELIGQRLPGEPYREAQQLILNSEETKIATFKVGKLEPGSYILSIRSTLGEEFSESTQLQYVPKSYCVFLHADKTVYQPGDIIFFRALVLNVYLKPLLTLNPHLILKDGKGNIVRQWPKIILSKGVFSGEFQLSEFPVLGDWTFEIEVNGQMYKKTILVADLVLPKFLVDIKAPEHVYFHDEKFTVSIRTMQLTGQNVNGELTVTAYPVIYSGVIQPIFQPPLRKVMYVNGQASTEINIKDELKLTEAEGSERMIVVEAAVEESLTGRRHNVSKIIYLHRTHYSLLYHVPSFYKPSLPYVVQLKLSPQENDKPLDPKPAKIRYGYNGEGEKSENKIEVDCNFDAKGHCQQIFIPSPISNQSLMDIEIFFMDNKKEVKAIKSAYSPTESYIQVQLLKFDTTVNDKIRFRIITTEPINFFSYYILGRGTVVHASTIRVVPAKKVEDFEFHVTQAMAPEATIIVYYVRENKEIISSSIQFKVGGLLQNTVKLIVKPDELEVSENFDVNIEASPNSYVAVMAGAPSPDFSISTNHHYKAGEGYGFTENQILSELRIFSKNDELHHHSKELSVNTTIEIFEKSGLFLMTNNKVNGQYSLVPMEDNDKVEDSTRSPLAGPYAFSHLPPLPAPRLHLGKLPTPTWLFTNITLGGDGRGNIGRRISENAGTDWAIGGWAIHPTLGLGFATTVSANIKMRLLSMAAPTTARITETISVTATIYNPYNFDVVVEIILHNNQQEFKFEEFGNDLSTKPKLDLYQKQKVNVGSKRSSSVVFFVIPTITPALSGTTITLEMSASGRGISESTQQYLTVFPDGEDLIEQVTELLDMRNEPIKTNLILKEKNKYDSRRLTKKIDEEIQITATGSLLSPILKVLPKLLQLPPASGYHNILPMMTSVLIYQYLEQRDQLLDGIKSTAVDIIQKGYQQQMVYRHNDGSFGLTMQEKTKGSVWATGMTALWMGKALRIIDASIQRSVVTDALQWLASQQSPDGSFKESSSITLDDPLQQNQTTLTALTLYTFLETRLVVGQEYNNLINKAQDWLARNVPKAAEEQWDATILAPLAGILHAAGHPSAAQATHILNSFANSSDGERWWELKTSETEMKSPWRRIGSRNIWVTSWGLRALLAQGYISEAFEAGKALVSFLSDWSDLPQPLIAVPALISLAQTVSQQTLATLEFQCSNDKIAFSINKGNNFIIQKAQIRQKECNIDGEGYGIATASLQALRRTNVTGAWPRFTLDPRVDAISTPHHLQLSICIGFVPLPGEKESGPVLMKLRLPTGFALDLDIPALQAGGIVRSAHENMLGKMLGEPPLQMILSPLNAAERCLTLRGSRLFPVANERPGVVTLVDLTDSSRRARAFFSGGSLSACELCGGISNRACSNANIQSGCLTPARQEAPLPPNEPSRQSSATRISFSNYIINVLMLHLIYIYTVI